MQHMIMSVFCHIYLIELQLNSSCSCRERLVEEIYDINIALVITSW